MRSVSRAAVLRHWRAWAPELSTIAKPQGRASGRFFAAYQFRSLGQDKLGSLSGSSLPFKPLSVADASRMPALHNRYRKVVLFNTAVVDSESYGTWLTVDGETHAAHALTSTS